MQCIAVCCSTVQYIAECCSATWPHCLPVRDTIYFHAWLDVFLCVTRLIQMCDTTHHMCDMTHSYTRPVTSIRVTWLIHMCDTTHSYAWHDQFICLTCLIYMCDMTHSYEWHNSFICVTWLIHMCDMTHSYVWHDSLIRKNLYVLPRVKNGKNSTTFFF